jgi:hypothetical protein
MNTQVVPAPQATSARLLSKVYSDDGDVCDYAREAGMEAYRLSDLREPPEDPQTKLPFDTA